MTDEGVREYSVASPHPPMGRMDENALKRADLRRDESRAELLAMWGGREPTELEQLDQSIAFLRGIDAEEMAPQIEALEKQRAELAAKQD